MYTWQAVADSDNRLVDIKTSIDERVRAWCCVCGRAYQGLTVGFLYFITDCSYVMLLFWILCCYLCFVLVCHTVLSVPCNLVVTCRERADLLALLYVLFLSVFSLFNTVTWVRCRTWFYRLLIFALLLTYNHPKHHLSRKIWPLSHKASLAAMIFNHCALVWYAIDLFLLCCRVCFL